MLLNFISIFALEIFLFRGFFFIYFRDLFTLRVHIFKKQQCLCIIQISKVKKSYSFLIIWERSYRSLKPITSQFSSSSCLILFYLVSRYKASYCTRLFDYILFSLVINVIYIYTCAVWDYFLFNLLQLHDQTILTKSRSVLLKNFTQHCNIAALLPSWHEVTYW